MANYLTSKRINHQKNHSFINELDKTKGEAIVVRQRVFVICERPVLIIKILTMKNLLIAFVITIFLAPPAKPQSPDLNLQNFEALYKATYQLTFQTDTNDVESKQLGMFRLYISGTYSFFVNHEWYQQDSIRRKVSTGGIGPGFVLSNLNTMPQVRTGLRIFKDRTNNQIISINSVFTNEYAYHDGPLSNIQWQIQPDTKMIGNLQCQLATGRFAGRDYKAWFTPEIKIPEGPFKFSGLPGLIVKIVDTRNHVSFELIDFKPTKKTVNVLPLGPVEFTTRQELIQKEREFNRNPIPTYEAMGAVFSSEAKRTIRERFRERDRRINNSIELKID